MNNCYYCCVKYFQEMKYLLFLFSISVFIVCCKHEPMPLPEKTGNVPIVTPPNDTPCFNTEILPIFNSNCANTGCHDANTKQKGFDFTHYNGIMTGIVPFNTNEGDIMDEINDNKMPPPPSLMDANNLAKIKKWIMLGAPNKICAASPCDTINVNYLLSIAPIIQLNCYSCHNTNNPSFGIDLSSYDKVKSETENGKLLCSIQQNNNCSKMPKNGGKLTPCQIRLFEIWKSLNYPQ